MQASLLDAVIHFAETSDTVTALILIGSRARKTVKADAYSDTDLLMIVKDTAPFLDSNSWLDGIGSHHITFVERTVDGQREKRVLFDDAQDVDFVIMDEAGAAKSLAKGEAALVMSRGYRMLVDKYGYELPQFTPPAAPPPPVEADYLNTVHDFWYHTVWSVKKLLRGEVWAAKFCVDVYMKQKLLQMIEQHERLVVRSGNETWYGGRFIDRWARADILADLQTTFAHYNRADIARALLNTMALFRRLATEVATAEGFDYPAHADAYATEWVRTQLIPLLQTTQN